MSQVCYLRNGTVYIPFVVRAREGLYMQIKPVIVVAASDTENFRLAVVETLKRKYPAVPLPAPQHQIFLDVPKAAGLKSWRTFNKGALNWLIRQYNDIWTIAIQRTDKPRGDDESQLINFPPGTPVEQVADRVVEVIQTKADELAAK